MRKIIKIFNFQIKNLLVVFFLLCFALLPVVEIAAQNEAQKQPNIIEHEFQGGANIRIEFIKEDIVRIRIVPKGSGFKNSGLNRYGFIQDISTENPRVKILKNKNGLSAVTPSLRMKINYLAGEISITDRDGKNILLKQIGLNFRGDIAQPIFNANKNEDWIGFGDQNRTRLYHRGYLADCKIRNVVSYIPVPFFMSTNGVGVLVNTTHHVIFDMCKTKPDQYSWEDKSGVVDYYIMIGNGFHELIDKYTQLTGRPKLPPEWAFGLWYIGRTQAYDHEIISDALNLRREKIPCDVIGLEPGWMSRNYDYSTEKKWDPVRFPISRGRGSFVNAIKRMGFKMELWLCNDYDLSYEEERRIGNDLSKKDQSDSTNDKFSVTFDGKWYSGGTVYFDKITKKDEPWFEHLKKFVNQGVSFFKQDASSMVFNHPDRVWGNGMKDGEMHNLYPLMYSRQMYDGLKEATKLRPVIFKPCGWTGFQSFGGIWAGDTGGGLSSLGGLLNTAIVGQSWSTVDMEVTSKEGIHYGYLLPWSEILSFSHFYMPWVQGKDLLDIHRFYAQFRSRLIPYLYSWGQVATTTGWPLLRPLTLEFPKDKNCRENLHQYLLGPDIMVGIYNKKIYFPEGEWKDYWTGQIIHGQQEKEVSWPENRGGALYVRSGAIIPLGPVMQYRGEKPKDSITLYIFPDKNETNFDFYEDDGVSFEHLDGKYSKTRITSKKMDDKNSTVNIGLPDGDYNGMVKKRVWNIVMHSESKPVSVFENGKVINEDRYSWDPKRKEVTINKIIAPVDISLAIMQ